MAPSFLGMSSALHCWLVVLAVPATPYSMAVLLRSLPIAPQHNVNSYGWLPIPACARARHRKRAARWKLVRTRLAAMADDSFMGRTRVYLSRARNANRGRDCRL